MQSLLRQGFNTDGDVSNMAVDNLNRRHAQNSGSTSPITISITLKELATVMYAKGLMVPFEFEQSVTVGPGTAAILTSLIPSGSVITISTMRFWVSQYNVLNMIYTIDDIPVSNITGVGHITVENAFVPMEMGLLAAVRKNMRIFIVNPSATATVTFSVHVLAGRISAHTWEDITSTYLQTIKEVFFPDERWIPLV